MTQVGRRPGDLFGTGPFGWLDGSGVLEPPGRGRWRLALAVAAITWVPLAVLSALEGLAINASPGESFLLDIGALGRYVVAAPLLVVAATAYVPQMTLVAAQFVADDLIGQSDRPRYHSLVTTTRRWFASRWSGAVLVLLAYAVTVLLSRVLYPADLSTWVAPVIGGRHERSLAGWWRLLISQPLYLLLCATALWRVVLWGRFLAGVARLDLRLVAAHPDRVGGLRFVTIPLQGFSVIAMAMGVVGASSVAESMLFYGRSLGEFRYLIGATVLAALVVLTSPLFALTGPLLRLKNQATCEYGRLASMLGREFQARWIAPGRPITPEVLGEPDFSATADLFAVAAIVNEIRPFVVDLRLLGMLAFATLLPYVPLLFLQMPFDDVMRLVVETVL